MTSASQGARDEDPIRQLRRWGRAQSNPSIRNRYRIIEYSLGRLVREPANDALRNLIARNVNELEELIRSSPSLVTPVARKARPRGKSKPIDNPAGVCDWISIDALVPRGMPDRDEVQQDAFVTMLEGAAPDPKTAVRSALKAYTQSHNKWRDLSMDAPIGGLEGFTLHDVIATNDIEGENDDWTDFNC